MERVGRGLPFPWARRQQRMFERNLARLASQVEGPEPPRRYTFSCSYGVGMGGLVAVHVAAVKEVMADRPYDLIKEGIGTEQELLERGVLDRPRYGRSHDARAIVGYLRYVRRDIAEPGELVR